MAKASYWERRFALLEKRLHDNSLDYYKSIEKLYSKAVKQIEADLSKWYARYAKSEGLTLAEAKKALTKAELKEFRMTVEEYIKRGQDEPWAKELERASVKAHISRLEALKLQLQSTVETLNYDFNGTFNGFAHNTYNEQYLRTAYEVQKGLRIGWSMSAVDYNTVDKVVRKPWTADKKNFSDRIWANKRKLVNSLHETLTSALARGENPDKTIRALSERMDVGRSQAGRLIMTEGAFFANAAKKDVFKALDVDRYEILATLDTRTSEICRDMDGQIFESGEMKIGTNAPPFHPWCRTTTVPYFEDEEYGERASRDEKGKYRLIPENITYRQWEKGFAEGSKDYDPKAKDEYPPVNFKA